MWPCKFTITFVLLVLYKKYFPQYVTQSTIDEKMVMCFFSTYFKPSVFVSRDMYI